MARNLSSFLIAYGAKSRPILILSKPRITYSNFGHSVHLTFSLERLSILKRAQTLHNNLAHVDNTRSYCIVRVIVS